MIHKNRGNRRKQNYKKAIRKAKLIHEWGDYFTYPSLHALSKLKIHCSCPLCSGKTNTKKQKAKGYPSYPFRNNLIATTNNRYGKKNYKISDRKKINSMNLQIKEYEKEE